jgi:hypothetical protein
MVLDAAPHADRAHYEPRGRPIWLRCWQPRICARDTARMEVDP